MDIVLYAEDLTQEDNTQPYSTDGDYRDIMCLTLRAPMSTTVDILCFNPYSTDVNYSRHSVFNPYSTDVNYSRHSVF